MSALKRLDRFLQRLVVHRRLSVAGNPSFEVATGGKTFGERRHVRTALPGFELQRIGDARPAALRLERAVLGEGLLEGVVLGCLRTQFAQRLRNAVVGKRLLEVREQIE